jgi:glycerol uptake facilitator-like aquaporin
MLKHISDTVYFWDEGFQENSMARCLVCEVIGCMFLLVFAGGMAMNNMHSTHPNVMQSGAASGFCIMTIAQFIGAISGGHINCAVTFGLFCAGRVSGFRFICYLIAQLFGSVLGVIILWYVYGSHYNGGNQTFAANEWDPSVFNGGQVFVAEAMGTAIILLDVLATVDIPVQGGGALGIFPISMSVLIAVLFLVPIDGCSVNPTRSFGTYLIARCIGSQGNFIDQHYVFWLGPMFGAALAAFAYGECCM